jgi:hypothetical protein
LPRSVESRDRAASLLAAFLSGETLMGTPLFPFEAPAAAHHDAG